MDDYRDQLKAMLREGFSLRQPELLPDKEYTARQIYERIWGEFEPWERRFAGGVFNRLVEDGEIPMVCLGESKRSGHSLVYRLK